jgi:serine/threonine-protein kinase RsbW
MDITHGMSTLPDRALSRAERAAEDGHIVRLTIPAKAEYITLCRLALTGLSRVTTLSEELLADLKLALTEAASNSVRHAYPAGAGVVEIAYELHGDRLAIEVSDEGEGFVHDQGSPEDEFEDLTEGGLGIAIIRAIADEFEISQGPAGRGSRLRFVKVLS